MPGKEQSYDVTAGCRVVNGEFVAMRRGIVIIALLACVSCCVAAASAAEGSAAVRAFSPGRRAPCVPKRVKAEQPLVRKAAAQATITVSKFAEYKAKFLERGEKATNRVDVLIAFDQSALRWIEMNGYSGREEFAADCLDRMNQVLVNSGLDGYFTFNLVGAPAIDIDVTEQYAARYADGWEYTEFSEALDDVAGETPTSRKDSAWRNVKEPAWAALRKVREQTCADVVSILVDSAREGTVGLAWALDGTSVKSLAYFSDIAYSMCCIEAVASDSTQVHEIGHLMGAGHSDEMDPEVYSEDMLGPQLFPYSSGHYFKTEEPRKWHYTVMGYNYPGWTDEESGEWIFAEEAPCFSSPSLFYDDSGIAMGDSAHDNARTLRETYAIVANFRVRRPHLTVLAPGGGGTAEGSGLYDPGKTATLKAKPEAGYVFAGWYAAYDTATGEFSCPLESTVDYRTTTLTYVVGEDTTVYARFAAANEDAGSLSLVDEGRTFVTDSGAASISLAVASASLPKVSVKGLPPGMKFNAKSLTITGTPSKPGLFNVSVSLANTTVKKAAAATFAINVVFPVVSVEKTGSGTGKVTGEGPYAAGKKVTLKATASKGSVFMGWYGMAEGRDGALVSQAASFSFVMTGDDARYVARFITAEEDANNISAVVGDFAVDAETPSFATAVPCGVYLKWPVTARALTAATVKVAGLPAGLKFTAKDIMKKGSKTEVEIPANTIYGAPTAASKRDKQTGAVTPSRVKVTVTTSGKTAKTFIAEIAVTDMPAWAVGTFNGFARSGEESTTEEVKGIVSLTIAANGKIGGKLLKDGQTWSLSAPYFAAFEQQGYAAGSPAGIGPVYVADVVGKSGKQLITNTVTVAAEPAVLPDGDNGAWVDCGVAACSEWKAWQNMWKRSDTKAKMPVVKKNIVAVLKNGIKLTIKKDGAVSFAGTVGSTKVSGSSQLVFADGCWQTTLHAPPKAGKFDGFTARVRLAWKDGEFIVEE